MNKKNSDISRLSIVEIEWLDHYSVAGWHSEPDKIPTYINKSVGFFIKQDEFSILLAMTSQVNDDKLGDAMALLKSCVLSMTVIKKA